MAKAQIKLPNGAHVNIEGTADEIKQLLGFYSQGEQSQSKPPRRRHSRNASNTARAKTRQGGPAGLIRELIEEGYFKGQKRSLSDIQKKLEEGGHIYAQTSLSTPMTRFTRKRELRRIKEKKGWVYVV